MTHTPGPWEVTSGTICMHVVSDNGRFSTGCISFDGAGEANARLIAAAPDMLEALKAHDAYMLEQFREGPDSSALHPKAAANWRIVRVAILKAQGQS